MNPLVHLEKTVLGFPISVLAFSAGQDLSVQILGGCRPHLGSVSTAYWKNETVTVKTHLLPQHRDDTVSDFFAKTLAERLHTNVSVLCGIHYDTPGPEGLVQILACTDALLQELLCILTPNPSRDR